MNPPRSSIDEMSQLVDELYDGNATPSTLARIESLILQHPRNLQAYVERFDFHCELLEQADHQPAELAALNVLHQSALATAQRESRRQWRMGLLVAACTLLVTVGIGWMFYSTVLSRIPVGTIASLSTNLKENSGPLELGQVVHLRETISIQKGIVSIQLSEVMIDLVGPGSIRLERGGVYLSRGTVIAKVAPKGIGFTVRTPQVKAVDLGTEFLVRHHPQEGSFVSVRRGAARAQQLDWRGEPIKEMDLTASRAARFSPESPSGKEVEYSANDYLPVDRSRGGVQRLTGAIRTPADVPASLASNEFTTPNHLLVIPEREVTLDSDLTVTSLSGPVTIPAGATVVSYLIHYDPTFLIHSAPRGAITFAGEIAAVIGSSAELNSTDPLFGLSQTQYESRSFRELELDEDEVRISDDRKTVSFFFGITPPELLDEARVLVVVGPP